MSAGRSDDFRAGLRHNPHPPRTEDVWEQLWRIVADVLDGPRARTQADYALVE